MKQACPKCRAEGKDSDGTHLKVFVEGNGYCHAGHGNLTKEEVLGLEVAPTLPKTYSKVTVDTIKGYPHGTEAKRKLPEGLAIAYGIHHRVNLETGEPDRVYYPLYAKDSDSITGYKVREIGTSRKFGPNIGKPPEEMWGTRQLEAGGRHLLVVEGEEDCMAAKAILNKSPSVKMDVVSLPNGAGLSALVLSEGPLFDRYKRVYIATDADAAGKKVSAELADWLSGITDVYTCRLGKDGMKDASDYWTCGAGNDFRKAIKEATLYAPDGIVNGTEITLEELVEPIPEGHKIPFAGIQNKLHGVRKAEILTVCAASGIGKTTVVREFTKSLIEEGLSVANVALEDQMTVAAQALIALDMEIPLAKFRFDPPSMEKIAPHREKMVANGHTYFYKHFGGLDSKTLMTKLYHYAKSKEVDFIILDHLSMVISASESNNERKDIDNLMTNLAKMVVETGVGLIQIVHLKRNNDKSFAKGAEVELTDLRGSAALEQLSWGVLALERDQQSDEPNYMQARVLKNRTWGYTGLADKMVYDPETGRTKSRKFEI